LEKHQKNSKTHGKVLNHFYSLFPEFAPLSEATAQSILSPNLSSSNTTLAKENNTEEASQNPTPMDTSTDNINDDKKIPETQLDTGVLREDLISEPKYPLRRKVDLLPHPLDSRDPSALYYKFWKNIDTSKHDNSLFEK